MQYIQMGALHLLHPLLYDLNADVCCEACFTIANLLALSVLTHPGTLTKPTLINPSPTFLSPHTAIDYALKQGIFASVKEFLEYYLGLRRGILLPYRSDQFVKRKEQSFKHIIECLNREVQDLAARQQTAAARGDTLSTELGADQ